MSSAPTHRSSADPRTDACDDAELLAVYLDGDTDAFTVLVYRYHRVLLAVVRNLTWFEPDPEAVVQEVWLRVLQSAHTFSGRATVSTWLHRITVNEAITAARRRRANHSTPVGELYRVSDIPERTEPGDPSVAVIDREHAAAVLPELLALLPRDQRLVLEVLHLDGLTIEEAAALFGVAVGTIKSRASRAQATVRAHVAARATRGEFLAIWLTDDSPRRRRPVGGR
ncbi:RNA polymerase sigma factor [Actinomycetospora straminea]|uniref:RNA polymerase ECF family sigma subunit n=1 Tax=Actinomycetospora straminea TaxID=663607 RepID=A0ABP9ENV6_9PSEU|nr:sigma-70 family RNA polymerase sigma factor [Actinomycetospora straminea]MDD7936720.1 sigma-70 family RNA polymerase sigma factor [Actinomycetospora straminea]